VQNEYIGKSDVLVTGTVSNTDGNKQKLQSKLPLSFMTHFIANKSYCRRDNTISVMSLMMTEVQARRALPYRESTKM
jgi:hypothetical protein